MRLYLTHLSCACALGRTSDEVWRAYSRGQSGLVEIAGDIPGRSIFFGAVPGDLPAIDDPEFNQRTNRLLAHAVENMKADLGAFFARHDPARVAIVLGTSNTGIDEAQRFVETWLDSGAKPAAFRFSQLELGTPADYLKRRLGVKGPAYSISTACSSSAKVFSSARRLIALGLVEAAIVGGVDGRCRFAMNGFHALGALAKGRCRPLAPDRDGINLGEGVALFTLEREAHGPRPVYFAGAGESSDAYHATAPDPEGRGAEAAMRAALAEAHLAPEAIGYVNLHGTGTPANDAMELKALGRVFPAGVRAESTKALTGHCLGAAGAVEAAICHLQLMKGALAGAALSNSFAFGGSNASIIFAAEEA